jgi:hypothetical protein
MLRSGIHLAIVVLAVDMRQGSLSVDRVHSVTPMGVCIAGTVADDGADGINAP